MITEELVFSCLGDRPLTYDEWALEVLKKLVKIEDWEETAWLAEWKPRSSWHGRELTEIAYCIRCLSGMNRIILTADFKWRKP